MTSLDEQSEELRGGRGRRESGGASQRIGYDPRVSKGWNWVVGVIGSLLVLVLGFCANNLWQLNLTMRDVLSENRTTVAQLSDHELRLRAVERSILTYEGRTLRGPPISAEVKRGN